MVKKLTFMAGCFDSEKRQKDLETDNVDELYNLREGKYNALIFSKNQENNYGKLLGVEKKVVVGVLRPLLSKGFRCAEKTAVIEYCKNNP